LDGQEDQFLSDLAIDDLFETRDQIHLAVRELETRGISIARDVLDLLARYDAQAQSNPRIKNALVARRATAGLFESSLLEGLWWWGTMKPERSTFHVPSTWRRKFLQWLESSPAPALAATKRPLAKLLQTAGPIWNVANVDKTEVSLLPLEGQLWLSLAGSNLAAVDVIRLRVNDRPVDLAGLQRSDRLLLVPLGLADIRTLDATIVEGKRAQEITVSFVAKKTRPRSSRKSR
jgi:hypothetical protein